MTFKLEAFMRQAIFQLTVPSRPYAAWTVILPLVPIPASPTLATPRSTQRPFSQQSRTKGRHITVILDCYYSAGNTRGSLEVARRATPLPPTYMFKATHTRLRHLPQYRSVFKGDWTPDMSCHIVLAACHDYQPTKEDPRKSPERYFYMGAR